MAGAGVLWLAGCDNVGSAPTGATAEQYKADLEKQPPLQQIRNIMFEPTQDKESKDRRIKEIEDKYHVKREDAMKDLPEVKPNLDQKPPEMPQGASGVTKPVGGK